MVHFHLKSVLERFCVESRLKRAILGLSQWSVLWRLRISTAWLVIENRLLMLVAGPHASHVRPAACITIYIYRHFEMLHLQLQLQLGARDGCDVIGLCVFGTHLTDGLTISVSTWRLAPLITIRDLQLVGMPSFTRYFAKMTLIYFISISSCQNVLPIYNRVYKIIFVPIRLT